ncbi:hypothetical protein D1Z33_12145 [Enterococcus faecalis]|nr:hypothetical protein [Enterococcus faecalis]
MFLSLKTLYRKRTVIWPFYFYTIIRTLSFFGNTKRINSLFKSFLPCFFVCYTNIKIIRSVWFNTVNNNTYSKG